MNVQLLVEGEKLHKTLERATVIYKQASSFLVVHGIQGFHLLDNFREIEFVRGM